MTPDPERDEWAAWQDLLGDDTVPPGDLPEAALRFLSRSRLLGQTVRFDVLALGWPANAREPAVLHIKNAFEANPRIFRERSRNTYASIPRFNHGAGQCLMLKLLG